MEPKLNKQKVAVQLIQHLNHTNRGLVTIEAGCRSVESNPGIICWNRSWFNPTRAVVVAWFKLNALKSEK